MTPQIVKNGKLYSVDRAEIRKELWMSIANGSRRKAIDKALNKDHTLCWRHHVLLERLPQLAINAWHMVTLAAAHMPGCIVRLGVVMFRLCDHQLSLPRAASAIPHVR
jgi:hypothetical protein